MAPADDAADANSEAAANSKWAQAFEGILRNILNEYEGTDAKMRDGMQSGMRKLFEFPYVVELGLLHKVGPLDLEQAQRIIFFPRLSDMRYYVDAFSRDTPESSARRMQLLKFKMMSVFYTLHRKDGALRDRFMHCGGLNSLVALAAEDHPVIQSQAVELLIEFLSPLMNFPVAGSSRQAHLHHEVYTCFCSGAFWNNLAYILDKPAEIFPKSHANCIRILAGAVGWLHPEGGAKPATGISVNMEMAMQALQHCLDGSVPMPPDIRGLAEDLLKELQEVPFVRMDPLVGDALTKARKELFDPRTEDHEVRSHVWQALRQLGNEAFGAGLMWPAIGAYHLALEESGDAVPDREASLIESNRALAFQRVGHHADAANAAANALARYPHNAKAAYRRAQALLELAGTGSGSNLSTMVTEAVTAAELAANLKPDDSQVINLLQRARQKQQELKVTVSLEPTSEPNSAGMELDSMD